MVAAGALDQSEVEDDLYAAADANGLVADDGERQCWATIRSGLSAGLQQPNDRDHTCQRVIKRKRHVEDVIHPGFECDPWSPGSGPSKIVDNPQLIPSQCRADHK
jgi:hypothetical protein